MNSDTNSEPDTGSERAPAGGKPPLVILTGPTAVGKTALSIRLAEKIGGEIVSADSMQVYRGMDIGSAKATQEERRRVPHYLIDVMDPSESFNVYLFQKMAMDAIHRILENGHIPILAGGTGFYIQSVLYGIDFDENDEDPAFREYLEKTAEAEGPEKLHEMLREKDPESAAQIHPNNIKRTIRALEYYEKTGRKMSRHNREQRKKEPVFTSAYFVLTDERQKLYERIDRRVDAMMEQGLLQEVQALRERGCTRDMVSMQGLGYKEILDYLDGRCTLEEAVNEIKLGSRHFARRQLTWFRRERDVIWLDRSVLTSEEEILDRMLKVMEERGISGGKN